MRRDTCGSERGDQGSDDQENPSEAGQHPRVLRCPVRGDFTTDLAPGNKENALRKERKTRSASYNVVCERIHGTFRKTPEV